MKRKLSEEHRQKVIKYLKHFKKGYIPWNKGIKGLIKHSEEYKAKLRLKKGELNPAWKGNKVSRFGLHRWIEKQLGRPNKCSLCNKIGKVDLANISQEYKRDLLDWEWLCRKCHMIKDGRMDKFKENRYIYG